MALFCQSQSWDCPAPRGPPGNVGVKYTLILMSAPTTSLQRLFPTRHREGVTHPSHTVY